MIRYTTLYEARRAWVTRWKCQHRASQPLFFLQFFFAKIRYHLLCFKHFGRFRLALFLLQLPEYFRFVLLCLFTHNPPLNPNVYSMAKTPYMLEQAAV